MELDRLHWQLCFHRLLRSWPFDPKTYSACLQSHVCTWPNFLEISSNINEDIVFTNQHIYEPKNICNQNRVKFPSLVFEIWCSQGFWDAQTHSLTHGQTRSNTECILHCPNGGRAIKKLQTRTGQTDRHTHTYSATHTQTLVNALRAALASGNNYDKINDVDLQQNTKNTDLWWWWRNTMVTA